VNNDRHIEARYRIDAVEAALDLLTLVGTAPDLGLSEIARRFGRGKTRTYRMLCSLEAKGFVTFSTDRHTYRLGMSALVLGRAASRQVDIARISAPLLARLGRNTDETPQLRIRQRWESLCVAAWEPSRDIKVEGQIGERRPLHAGSGLVLLAFMEEAEREEILKGPLQRFTDRTCIDPKRLRATLGKVRQCQLYISYGEVSPDLMSICVPVLDSKSQILAALSLGAPAGRVTEVLLAQYIEAVRNTATDLTPLLEESLSA
jgi:IclR family KDG regulon transcriptional repressor